LRQLHRAGEKLFVDYAGQSIGYGGEGDRAQIFVATLGASNYTFACATAHQRLADWTGALVRALEYIDGVPSLIVPDNAKALIADPDRYEPRASATIEDLSRHYGTAVLPARPYRPQTRRRHRDTQQIGARALKLLVMQSLKIVATHTFGSREYRLDAELVLIIGPLFPRGGLVHENPVSASSQVGFHSHHLRLR
jgi:transposase